jgi:D-alanyl-D-alanine carboxypeptidase (penicillin-binding protein 5/6)
MGSKTKTDCFKGAAQLLNQGFATYRMVAPIKGNVTIEGREAAVDGGVVERVPLMVAHDVKVLVKKGEEKKLQVEFNIPEQVPAPLKTGQVVGEVNIKLDGTLLGKAPVAAAKDVEQASLLRRWLRF